MTTKEQSIEGWLSQLSDIEFEKQRLLIAEVRSRDLLTDDEWIQVKTFLKEALTFLSGPQNTVAHKADGSIVIDPDADLRMIGFGSMLRAVLPDTPCRSGQLYGYGGCVRTRHRGFGLRLAE
jgi:hypothetical protein